MPGPGTGPRPGGWETLQYTTAVYHYNTTVYWWQC